jgi:hypothetical protein
LQKKRFPFWNKDFIPAMILASVIGTFLDHYFVKSQLYEFPFRPFPEFFSVNIIFTFLGLPIFVMVFLHYMTRVNSWGKAGLIIFLSLLMPILEKFAEVCGLFVHSRDWKHIYTFAGYLIFLTTIYLFHQWLEKKKR